MEASVDADQNLDVTDPSVLFDLYLNTCPGQGSRTIRTEVRAYYDIGWTTKHYVADKITVFVQAKSTACKQFGFNAFANLVFFLFFLFSFQQEAILVSMSGLRPKITAAFSDVSNGLLKS